MNEARTRRESERNLLVWLTKYWHIFLLIGGVLSAIVVYASVSKVKEIARVEAISVTFSEADIKEIIKDAPPIVELQTKVNAILDNQKEQSQKLDRLLSRRSTE